MNMTRFQFISGISALFTGCNRITATGTDPQARWMKYTSGHLDDVASYFMAARLAIAPAMQAKFYGFSGCERCLLPWPLVPSHSTDVETDSDGSGWGVSPLCEDCWSELGRGEFRWPYYESSWRKYSAANRPVSDLELIRKAVMAEKDEPRRRGIMLMSKIGGKS